uniref:THAP-type domain-containing protein n=1 Tax=Oryzias latipes TaxID=8090 RepID=A0A3P9HYZ0_ORYLA
IINMPSRCVAAGCSNTSSESVSVFKFPKQETLLKQWTKQVQRTRANWVPTASSTLCSEHFEADCFEETPQLMKDMGMHVRYKKVLKPNAITTIFKRSLVGTSETETPSTSTGSIEPIIPSSPDLPSSQPDPVSADDSDYLPSSSQTPSSSDSERKSTPPPTERFFLVAWSALSMLLNLRCCAFCQEMDMDMSTTTQGTMLCVLWTCKSCKKVTKWKSQPFVGDIPLGNILLSVAILSTGALATKVLRMFQNMKLAYYLLPSITHLWAEQQAWLIACLQAEQRGIVLAGDGRSDSPGHSAKYGTYTMLELPANVIIDMQLVQSNEVGGASHMEKEGFIRSVNFLGTQQGLDIDVIITDRHVQLRKWIRENLPDVQHLLDVWHLAKGLRKKLVALSKEKDCTDLKEWIDSIINHLYWSVMSTDSAEPNLVEAKWTSVLNHIVNIHTHNNELFPKCEHKRLRGRAARKKWLKPCSTMMVKLEKLAVTTYLIRDLKQASNREQTSSLEAFHSLLNHYAPKMYAFSYEGQLFR